MKSFLKSAIALLVLVAAAQGNLSRWLQDIEVTGRLESVFFKSVALPGGSVVAKRAPAEARVELGKLIQAAPSDAELYALRGMQAEELLDFPAAEADFKKHVELAPKSAALADYFHRRLQPLEELAALTAAGLHERAVELVEAQGLDRNLAADQYKAWVKLEPVHAKAIEYLNRHKLYAAADEILAAYRRDVAANDDFAVRNRADIEFAKGNAALAAEIWDRAFDPLWPPSTLARYFDVVGGGRDRQLVGRLQKESKPDDLIAAAKLYHLQQRLNNAAGARRALVEARARKQTWTPAEWRMLGQLFEAASMSEDAARSYHSLYLASPEEGLSLLARLLLDMPEQPLQLGAGDLSLYRDVAAMDQGPGFLNGVLSLILNSSGVEWEYDRQNQAARAYFHRTKAAELLDLLDKRFPASAARPSLHAKLIQAYAVYGDREGVIRNGRQYLQSFPAAERTAVTFLLADAYAAVNQVDNELAAYDALLQELGARAGNVPIGAVAEAKPGETAAVKSPDYARALDRYVSRLAALKRVPQALAVYRQELGRNAGDPGLYERFAAFLDQNKLGGEVEQVYRQAFQKFNDDTFSHKLARWYLRAKQTAQFEALTREVTRTFSGTGLEHYFGAVVASGPVAPALYLQLNLYANQRFPHNGTFVRNLLRAYETRGTADAAAYERLLRQHWFESDDLRARFFQLLSRSGRLQAEMDAMRGLSDNPVAGVLLAEGEIWRTHFEAAAAPMQAAGTARAAALHRSLGRIDAAASIERNLAKAAPRDSDVLTRLGEMQADQERFAAAKPYWEKIPAIEPGKSERVIETATLYWDYFQFDDALRVIDDGRKRLNNATLAAYEAGVIRENQSDYGRALDEYVRGALTEEDDRSKARLLRLSRRMGQQVEQRVAAATANREDLRAIDLRIAMLEGQNRRADLETFLTGLVNRTSSVEVIARAEAVATLNAMRALELRAMERRVELAPDAVDQLRARLQLMRFLESRNETAAAARIVDEAYRQNPASLGVIRTAVNFHWRNQNGKRAVAILSEAAAIAKGSYPESFRFEAARKAMDLNDFSTAKALIDGLLAKDPHRPGYLAAGADVLARQSDDAGLKAFYAKAIESLRASALAAEDKNNRISTMRRGLIPVLARQQDWNGAVDQYIEIVNRFAEDESLVDEAAVFANANGMNGKLLGFYSRASTDSPRDYRWPLVLSRVQSRFGDLGGSLASLARATAIRPDRVDFMITRAKLEERTLRFEEALQSYVKIWDLSYRDPSWMIHAAEQHMRLARPAQAVAVLKQGFIDNQPEQAANYARLAGQLLDWNLVKEAQEFAPKATPELQALIAVRLRQPVAAQMPAEAVGAAIDRYYAPQEKAGLTLPRGQRGLEIARAAQLKDIEAARLAETSDGKEFYALINVQRERGRFDELGQQLEAIGRNPARAGENAEPILRESARSFQQAGNAAGEIRVLNLLASRNQLAGELLSRYAILTVRQPLQQAVAVAGGAQTSDAMKNAIATASVFAPRPADTFAIIAARGRARPPVWTRAYTALSGVYLGAAKDPQVKAAFEGLLGSRSIGEQLARKPDRTLQLTGKDWFYYAARYGQNMPGGEEYELADLEGSPATAALYLQLGDAYLERGEYAKAQAEFDYALALQPVSGEAMRKSAFAIYAQGKGGEALAAWRRALRSDQVNLTELLRDLALAKQIEPLRADLDPAIRAHLRRSGGYEAAALLQPLASDTKWMLELATSTAEPEQILESLFDSDWLNAAQREAVLSAAVQAAERKVQSSLGDARGQALQSASRWHLEQSRDWLARREFAKAREAWNAADEATRNRRADEYEELSIRIAAAEGRFEPLMERYRANPDGAPSLETMQRVASMLEEPKDAAALLEYAYRREIDHQRLSAAVLLGLAKIRLQQDRVPDAVALLRRMNDAVGEPFSTTALAGELLLQRNRPQEAREFTDALAKARPWDSRVKLLADPSAQTLKAIAESSDVPYEVRCEAAVAMRRSKAPALRATVEELNLLSSQAIVTEQQASASPYTFALRRLAASQTQDANARYRLQAGALAMRPGDPDTRRDLFRAAMQSRRFAAATSVVSTDQASIEDLKLLTDAYLRQGRNSDAVEAAQRLHQMRASGAKRLLEIARGAQELQRLNEQRMPVFQENYDQNHIVQPKLAALPKRGGIQ